jgi:hypothetical protein
LRQRAATSSRERPSTRAPPGRSKASDEALGPASGRTTIGRKEDSSGNSTSHFCREVKATERSLAEAQKE